MANPGKPDKTKNRWDDFVGPLRTKATWKPRTCDTPMAFYQCPECKTIYTMHDSYEEITAPGSGRDKMLNPPLNGPAEAPCCCGKPTERLPFLDAEEVEETFEMNYKIVGGVNMNAIKVSWFTKNSKLKPRWVTIKTFTGSQTKYIMPDKFSPVIFALADEDAFTYCHDNPCHECVFRCKSGFEIYMYVEGMGIIRRFMDRIDSIDMTRNV